MSGSAVLKVTTQLRRSVTIVRSTCDAAANGTKARSAKVSQ